MSNHDDTPNTIDLLFTLHEARRQLDEAKQLYAEREAEVNALLAPELDNLRSAQANVAKLDIAVRASALDLYDLDRDFAAGLPGVKFISKRSVMLDIEAAKAWAVKGGMLMMLKLDESAAKKMASVAPVDWATETVSTELRIDSNLGNALAALDTNPVAVEVSADD